MPNFMSYPNDIKVLESCHIHTNLPNSISNKFDTFHNNDNVMLN